MKTKSANTKLQVPGFRFSGISCGIKKPEGKDLALIVSDKEATAAGVFTTNKIKAAPVNLAIDNIKSQTAQAIIINSGNANACTGKQGEKDALLISRVTAKSLGLTPENVYVSSTGIIGRPLPADKIKRAIPKLVNELSPASIINAAESIMTTDTFHKIASKRIKLGDKTGTIAAIAKGAGMICPNMATMLCFIMTDIAVSKSALKSALTESVSKSFNVLKIDNDMSTNDTVMIMANGALNNRVVTLRSENFNKFKVALNDLTYDLAGRIAMDGEGATKLIEVRVRGAKSDKSAEKAASSIASSMLVKTAVYGKDPNWGRIIAAIGYSGAEIKENRISISINKVNLFKNGTGTNKEQLARQALSGKAILIEANLNIGSGSAKALSCDLTEKYIDINAHYST